MSAPQARLLEGHTALVTGGARGIGAAIASTLHRHGANVVIADLDGRAAESTAASLGAGAHGVGCDVTDEASVSAAVDVAVSRFGELTALVNNAGITRDKTIRNMSAPDFKAVVDVHLYGAWLGTKYAAEAMRAAGHGSIVNISSISGKVGMFGQSNYSAAKAGMVGLTKSAAKELARHKVRVNAIQPGLIRTPMTEAIPAAVWDSKLSEIPLGRAGEPEEVADAVLFFASYLSAYVTGTVLEVAGGRHI